MLRTFTLRVAIPVGLALLITAAFLRPGVSPRPEADGPDAPPQSTALPKAASASSSSGSITAEMQAEIDRVVAAGRPESETAGKASGPRALLRGQVRCARFEELRYCLHTGWTTRTEGQVRRTLSQEIDTKQMLGESTGDEAVETTLMKRAALRPSERIAADRDELTRAALSVAKAWEIEHGIRGRSLPDGFAARHPEANTTVTKGSALYPEKDKILWFKNVADQTRSYWCGPTTMQMIAWGWHKRDDGQDTWARRLGTTTSGTAITSMTQVVNDYTGYDSEEYAGPYIVLDVGDYSYLKWIRLIMRHIHDYNAPVVMHPILSKEFFPYLDDDASGHYQVGRGYHKRGPAPADIGYFEPWNQQRFDPSEPYIKRVQWQPAYASYRANLAHPFHNIGV
jgi:hypothetical protein